MKIRPKILQTADHDNEDESREHHAGPDGHDGPADAGQGVHGHHHHIVELFQIEIIDVSRFFHPHQGREDVQNVAQLSDLVSLLDRYINLITININYVYICVINFVNYLKSFSHVTGKSRNRLDF